MFALLLMGALVARFTLFSDAEEFRSFSIMLRRRGTPIIGIWMMVTIVSILPISAMEKTKQEKAMILLKWTNYVLAALFLGGLFAAFRFGLLA
ncbi:hypothetical protein [Mesorhizobium erdmanii]|nr:MULTISPECIES: hypothetical protein [Mesorhizobium]